MANDIRVENALGLLLELLDMCIHERGSHIVPGVKSYHFCIAGGSFKSGERNQRSQIDL